MKYKLYIKTIITGVLLSVFVFSCTDDFVEVAPEYSIDSENYFNFYFHFISMSLKQEIEKRKTFGIISHPDAGKTTLTEKLLLFGGAIQVAGAVKSNKIKKTATSDFMEIEKQRGISVATSVMGFEYGGKKGF